jgi:predicted nucleic acid-binding protein
VYKDFDSIMTQLVADSSALILLAKCGLLDIVCDLFEVVVPSAVMAEVASRDLIRNYPDAALISDLISRGTMQVENPVGADSSLPISLHQGEQDALLLALQRKGVLFATDDGKAIKAARFLRVPFIVSPKMVVELFRLKRISFKKARQSLEKLGRIGRYSPEIIADALVSLTEEKNGKAHNYKDT